MKFLFLAFIALSAHAATPVSSSSEIAPYGDTADLGCFDAAYAKQLGVKYGVDWSSFEDGMQLCDNSKQGKMMLNILVMIDKGKIGPTKKHGFDHQFFTGDYIKYFRDRIKTIQVDTECGVDWAVACVVNQEPTMHVEAPLFDNETLAFQLTTLIHEARHVDGYLHVACETGPYAGVDGTCDSSYNEAGSYAVEVEYETRIALNGVNFNPMFKTFARLEAADEVESSFVDKPSAGSPLLVLVDKADSHLAELSADGKKLVEHAQTVVPPGSNIVDRAKGANVILADRAAAPLYLDYYSFTLFPQAPMYGVIGSTMRDFTAKWTPAKRADFVDMLNDISGRGYQIRAFKSGLEASKGADQAPSVRLPEATEPKSLDNVLPCLLNGKMQTGYFLRMASNHIYKVQISGTDDPMTLAKQSCVYPADIDRVVKYKTQLVALTIDGQLQVIGADGKRTPFLAADYAARRFSAVVGAKRYDELMQ